LRAAWWARDTAAVLTPLLLVAEVADKMGPLWIPWGCSIALGLLAFALVGWRWWTVWAMLPLTLGWGLMLVGSATEPDWMPAVYHELGPSYFVAQLLPAPLALLAAVAPVLRTDLPIARAWWASRARRRAGASNATEPYRQASPDTPRSPAPARVLLVSVAAAAALVFLAAYGVARVGAASHAWEPRP
jgi:hypothetical protein